MLSSFTYDDNGETKGLTEEQLFNYAMGGEIKNSNGDTILSGKKDGENSRIAALRLAAPGMQLQQLRTINQQAPKMSYNMRSAAAQVLEEPKMAARGGYLAGQTAA